MWSGSSRCARTCQHKVDPDKRPGAGVSPLGLHADVHQLPSGVRLEHLRLAGRQDAREGVPCALAPPLSACNRPCHAVCPTGRTCQVILPQSCKLWDARQRYSERQQLFPFRVLLPGLLQLQQAFPE